MNNEAFTILHNPACSKSRKALEILQQRGVKIKIIEYLADPPSEAELIQIIHALKLPPETIVRKNEARFKELNFDLSSIEEVAKNLAANPDLLERPIVVFQNSAILARPPERLLDWKI